MIIIALKGRISKTVGQKEKLPVRVWIAACNDNNINGNCDAYRTTDVFTLDTTSINTLNAELNPICCLLALLGAHHFLHVSRIRVKSLNLRILMIYIYIYIYIYIWSTHS